MRIGAAVDALRTRATSVHVQLDLDVLDPAAARANELAPAGGLSPGELREVVATIARRVPVRSLGISAFDPAFDEHGQVFRTVGSVLEALAR